MSWPLRSHSRQPNQLLKHSQLLKLWPRRHSAITPPHLLTRSSPGPRLTPEGRISRSRWVSSRWCRPAHSMARPTRMLALISNNSWSSVALLLSREYLKMQSGSDCFCSLYLGEQSSGSILTRVLWTHGTIVPRHFSRSSF